VLISVRIVHVCGDSLEGATRSRPYVWLRHQGRGAKLNGCICRLTVGSKPGDSVAEPRSAPTARNAAPLLTIGRCANTAM
jgi:hypothetical protein